MTAVPGVTHTDGLQDARLAPFAPGSHPAPVSKIRASIVIPTYNSAPTLRRCLDALAAQQYPQDAYEVLVVDDGSSDDTREVVESYANGPAQIRYWRQEHGGPALARNHGAWRTQGEILLFTDADCEPCPDWLPEMLKPFDETDAVVDAVKGAYRTKQESFIARFAQMEFEFRYQKMLKSDNVDFVDTYSAAFRRHVFTELKGFDTSFPLANNEDVEFSYRMAARGHRMVFNPNAIVYHQHPDTVYRYLRTKFGRAYWRMAVYRTFPDKMKSDSYTPQTLKLQIMLAFLALCGGLSEAVTGRGLLLSLLAAILFAVTTVPFLIRALNSPALNALAARVEAWGHCSPLRRLLSHLAERYQDSALAHAVGACDRGLKRLILGTIRGLRRLGHSAPVRVLLRGLHRTASAILTGLGGLLSAAGWLLRLPFTLARRTLSAAAWLVAAFWRSAPMRYVRRALGRLARHRVVMLPLALVLLLLRAIVMGLGILWGLHTQQSHRGRFSHLVLLLVSDALGLVAALPAAYATRQLLLSPFRGPHLFSMMSYLPYLPFACTLTLVVFALSGLYRVHRGLSLISEFAMLARSLALVAVLAVALIIVTHVPYSKSLACFYAVYALFLTYVLRGWTRRVIMRFSEAGRRGERTRALVVGTGELACLICRKLERNANIDTTVVGMLAPEQDQVGSVIDGCPVVGTFDELTTAIESHDASEVFVALPMIPQEEVMELVNLHSRKRGVSFHIVSNMFDLISAEVDIATETNIPVTHLRNDSMALLQQLLKRTFDIVVSGLLLLVTLPFWLLIMLAIRLDSDGRAIFKQARVGKDGVTFEIYKFRTMFSDTDKFEYSPSKPGDRRITRLGRFLRRTSLDEFPQFLNVLRGEMSLVGPRPEMPFIVANYKDWERQRLLAKPGITGLWQIMGRKDLPLHESLEYDFYYIKNQSLLLDLTILLKTIPVIIKGSGAY